MALDAVYGIETREENDPYILLIENAVHSLIVTANAGSYAGEFYIPGPSVLYHLRYIQLIIFRGVSVCRRHSDNQPWVYS